MATQERKVDRFGSRVGTVRAVFNAALSGKPKTAAAIAEKVGYPAGRIRSYLAGLAKRDKRVQKTEKGWKVSR
jgi:hypothetical protein